jgi:hypothetical protein
MSKPRLNIRYFLTQKETSIQCILKSAQDREGEGEIKKAACWWSSLKPGEKRLICKDVSATASSSAIQCLLKAEIRPFAVLCNGLWVAFYPPVTRVFSPCHWVYQLLPLCEQDHVPEELRRALPIPLADQARYRIEILHNLKDATLSSKDTTKKIKRKMAETLGLNETTHTLPEQYISKFHNLLVCAWQDYNVKQQVSANATHSPSVNEKDTLTIEQVVDNRTEVLGKQPKTKHIKRKAKKRSKTCENATTPVETNGLSSSENSSVDVVGHLLAIEARVKRSKTCETATPVNTETSESTLPIHEEITDKPVQLQPATRPENITSLNQRLPNTQNHTENNKQLSVSTEQQVVTVTTAIVDETPLISENDRNIIAIPLSQQPTEQTAGPPQLCTTPELSIFDEGDIQAFEIQWQRKLAHYEHAVQLLEPQHCSE